MLDKYLFYLFESKIIDLANTNFKAFGKSLNSATLKLIDIPTPDIDVQKEIIQQMEDFSSKKELSAEQQAIADEREKLQREIEAFNKMKGVSESEDNLLLDKKAKKVTV